MALRSPVQIHNFWGTANPSTNLSWVAGDLPNEGAIPSYQSSNLEAGDFAYVAADSTFYVCTDPGPGNANAVWVALVVGPTADADRFAPKYLVGGPNDTAAALAGIGGFWFFPDPGDGSGIEDALTQANIVQGDVWIRPGTFDMTGIVNPLPLQIPAGVRVMGAGSAATIISYTVPSSTAGTIFNLNDGSELRDVGIIASDASDALGDGVVTVANAYANANCERVSVSLSRDPSSTSNLRAAFHVGPDASLTQDRCDVVLTGTGGSEALPPDPIEPVAPPAPTGSTWTVGTLGGENFPDLITALASGSVVDGDRLLLSAQTFTSAAITVAKQVTIQGAGIASTVIQTAAAAGDPVTLITVTANNVTLRDLTVKQRKTTNTSIETAISINPPGGGAGASGHYLEAVRVETMEFGVVIRSDGWQINNCQLAYTGPNNSTRRLIGCYRSDGQGLFTNSTYDSGQNGVITGNTRVFTVLSTTGLPTETLGGYLRIGNVTPANAFPVQQFFNCEWFQPGATPLTFYVDGCTSAETSAFIVWTQANTQPPLSQSALVVVTNNTLTNSHGKGVYAMNGSHVVIGNPGTTTFWAPGNTLGATAFLGTFVSGILLPADATEAAQIGYDTLRWSNPNQPLAGGVTPPTPATALAGWRALGPIKLDLCTHSGGDAGVLAFSDADVDESSFATFGLVGVYCQDGDLAVTGATKIVSTAPGAVGIECDNGEGSASALINARIVLLNEDGGAEVGLDLNVESGQVFGSRIEASNGIVSSNAGGRGVAIGFNNVISQAGQQISSQVVDEVAHNILST